MKLKFFMQERNSNEWGVQIRDQGEANFHFSLIPVEPLDSKDLILEVESYKFVIDKALSWNKILVINRPFNMGKNLSDKINAFQFILEKKFNFHFCMIFCA